MPIHRLPTPDAISRAIVDILTEPGALPLDDVLAALAAHGLAVDADDPEFADAMDLGEGAEDLMELDDWVVHIGSLLRGRVFTHRVGSEEAEDDALDLFPDCVAMLFTLPAQVPVEFDTAAPAGGNPDAVPTAAGEPNTCPVVTSTDEDVMLVLPAGSLAAQGIRGGDLVGISLTDGLLTITRIDEAGDTPAADLTAASSAPNRAAVDVLHRLYEQTEGLTALTQLVLRAIVEDRLLFTTPQAPLTDILADADIPVTWELFAEPVAAAVHQLGRQALAARLAKTYELSPEEADLMAAVITALEAADALHDLADDEREPARPTPDVTAAMHHMLMDPWFAYILAEEVYGPASATGALGRSGDSPTLAAILDDAPPTGPRPYRAGLLYLKGRHLEATGSPLAAANAYRRAADLVDVPYPLGRLAVLEFYRGNFEVARSLLDQADAPADDLLRDQIAHALGLPPAGPTGQGAGAGPTATGPERKMGRNEPCWCGSGRKFKVCHARADARAPLPNRAATIYDRLCWFVLEDAGDDVRDLMELAAAASKDGAPPHFILPLALDLLLAEGGMMTEFRTQRGELLPDDEVMIIEQWQLGARSVFEVEATVPGVSVSLRDLRTGDHLKVSERAGSQSLRPGSFICTRVADVAGQLQAFGGFQPVRLDRRESLLDLLDANMDPEVLMVTFAGAFAPPTIVTAEGDPMVLITGTYSAPDPAALRAVLDEHFVVDEVNEVWLWTEEAGPNEVRTLAQLELTDDELRIETQSEARFERILDLLDGFGVDLVEVRVEEVDPMDAVRGDGSDDSGWDGEDDGYGRVATGPGSGLLTTEEALAIPELADFLAAKIASYEQAWLDESIPALAGFTPRQAAADPTRRDDLIRLLDTFPATGSPHQMDAGRLRAALGL